MQPAADPVVEAHRELDRLHPPEVLLVQHRPRARPHRRGDAGDARDGVDRMTEQVAVVHLRAAAEVPHRLPHLRLDEGVDRDGRPTLHAVDRQLEVVQVLHARVPDLPELLLRELRLERLHEPRRGRARGVRDDVQLDGLSLPHGRILAAPAR